MEISKVCRWTLLDFGRGIDEVDNAKKSSYDILGSLLTLLRRNEFKVVLEQLLELSNDVIDAGENHHD